MGPNPQFGIKIDLHTPCPNTRDSKDPPESIQTPRVPRTRKHTRRSDPTTPKSPQCPRNVELLAHSTRPTANHWKFPRPTAPPTSPSRAQHWCILRSPLARSIGVCTARVIYRPSMPVTRSFLEYYQYIRTYTLQPTYRTAAGLLDRPLVKVDQQKSNPHPRLRVHPLLSLRVVLVGTPCSRRLCDHFKSFT